jgi:hypothetical protein
MRFGLILLPAALLLGGCQQMAFPLYVFAPEPPTQTVESEYEGLREKTVAIVIFASPDMLIDYQTVQLELSDAVGAELRRTVKDVKIVDARRVVRYQDENTVWDRLPPGKLCDTFKCDRVLMISLIEFSTREPGSVQLARARISADAGVYTPDTPDKPKWHTPAIRVVNPPDGSKNFGGGAEWQMRVDAEKMFAEALVKKFYKHEVPQIP